MKWMKSELTEKNLEKIAKKYDVKITKTAFCNETMEKEVTFNDYYVPSDPDHYKKTSNSERKNAIPLDNDKFINLAGLQQTDVSYNGLLNPICKYAFAKLVEELGDPLFFTSSSFSKYPGTCEIPVDVDKTETVVNDACIVYPDKILTIGEQYGTVSVVCYAKDKKETKTLVGNLNEKMKKENQYRGKCLFFSDESIVFRDTPAVDWEDVVMSQKKKDEIRINTVDFLTNQKFANLGINRRGLILYGPPGTGKTMMIKSLFNKMSNQNVTRVYATSDTFTYPGIVSQLFDFLGFTGKTILAFEDMDLISPERSDGSGRKILGALLNNLDGIRKMADPLVVVGTTNDIGMIDKALANRPCRFDRKIEVPLPEKEQAQTFFSMLMGSAVDDDILDLSVGFSGAHIKEAVNTARLLAAETGTEPHKCLKDACTIIKENFFPMTKEASKALYKNENSGLKKEAQVALITPLIMNPFGGDMSFAPIFRLLRRPSEYSNKEATSLWKIWKAHSGEIKNNKIAISERDFSDDIKVLTQNKLMETSEEGKYALTDKGKKLLRSIILTSEVNTFEKNSSEPNEIDMNVVEKKIHGSASKKMKKASLEKTKKVDGDWYFNAIKNIKKD